MKLSTRDFDLRDRAEIERAEKIFNVSLLTLWDASYGVSEFMMEVNRNYPELLSPEDRTK